MDAPLSLLLVVLLIALVFGAAAQFSRVCLPGSLRDWVIGHDRSRLAAYLVAIGARVARSAPVPRACWPTRGWPMTRSSSAAT